VNIRKKTSFICDIRCIFWKCVFFGTYIYLCLLKTLWQRGRSSVYRGYTSVCYRNMGNFFIAPPFLFWQRFVSTRRFETVRDVEELVARGQWRIHCMYPRVLRRAPLSYERSDSVGIIRLWDRWREPVNKKRSYCSSGEMVEEDDVCCAECERSVCKKGVVSGCLYEQILCTFPVKIVIAFTLLSARVTGEKVTSGQEINCHLKSVDCNWK
jgi:hypothetical protein